ncbi:MAG: hypothetical protein P4L51_12900 [Puia sp.]|nr:hypothetical protein [Puia sp.]
MLLTFQYQDKPVFFEYEKDESGEVTITCFHRFFNEIFQGNRIDLKSLKAQVSDGVFKNSDFIRSLLDASLSVK